MCFYPELVHTHKSKLRNDTSGENMCCLTKEDKNVLFLLTACKSLGNWMYVVYSAKLFMSLS